MRRQLSGVVKYCLPSSCWPANTSHRRNSAFSRPSGCLVMRPVTSACALITRQSAKRGTASELLIFSMKACGLIGANRPLRCRLLVMTPVTLCAMSPSPPVPARKSGSAIGIGCTLPCVTSRRTTAAGRARNHRRNRAGCRRQAASGGDRRAMQMATAWISVQRSWVIGADCERANRGSCRAGRRSLRYPSRSRSARA